MESGEGSCICICIARVFCLHMSPQNTSWIEGFLRILKVQNIFYRVEII